MKAPAFLAPLLHREAGPCVLVDQRGRTIAARVHGAFDSASRKKGLLGRDGLDEDEAIVIAPCNAVHTFFMRFPIDVVHVDGAGRIVRLKPNLAPWRVDACLRGFAVIELPAGAVARADMHVGDHMSAQRSDDDREPSPNDAVR